MQVMCVVFHIGLNACIYAHMFICTHAWICMCVYELCVCMPMCVLCICTCTSTSIHLCVCVCVRWVMDLRRVWRSPKKNIDIFQDFENRVLRNLLLYQSSVLRSDMAWHEMLKITLYHSVVQNKRFLHHSWVGFFVVVLFQDCASYNPYQLQTPCEARG